MPVSGPMGYDSGRAYTTRVFLRQARRRGPLVGAVTHPPDWIDRGPRQLPGHAPTRRPQCHVSRLTSCPRPCWMGGRGGYPSCPRERLRKSAADEPVSTLITEIRRAEEGGGAGFGGVMEARESRVVQRRRERSLQGVGEVYGCVGVMLLFPTLSPEPRRCLHLPYREALAAVRASPLVERLSVARLSVSAGVLPPS